MYINNYNKFVCVIFQNRKQNRIQRIGAQYAVQAICKHFGKDLRAKVPVFWSILTDTIKITDNDIRQMNDVHRNMIDFNLAAEFMTSLQLMEICIPHIHADIIEQLFELLPMLRLLLQHPLKAVCIYD